MTASAVAGALKTKPSPRKSWFERGLAESDRTSKNLVTTQRKHGGKAQFDLPMVILFQKNTTTTLPLSPKMYVFICMNVHKVNLFYYIEADADKFNNERQTTTPTGIDFFCPRLFTFSERVGISQIHTRVRNAHSSRAGNRTEVYTVVQNISYGCIFGGIHYKMIWI